MSKDKGKTKAAVKAGASDFWYGFTNPITVIREEVVALFTPKKSAK